MAPVAVAVAVAVGHHWRWLAVAVEADADAVAAPPSPIQNSINALVSCPARCSSDDRNSGNTADEECGAGHVEPHSNNSSNTQHANWQRLCNCQRTITIHVCSYKSFNAHIRVKHDLTELCSPNDIVDSTAFNSSAMNMQWSYSPHRSHGDTAYTHP